MLNSPNEWHNEEDTNEDYNDEESYDENYYEDDSEGEYEESSEEYEDDDSNEEEYEDDEEDSDDDDDDDGDDGDGGDEDAQKKRNIIIAIIIILLFLLLGAGFVGVMKFGNKNAPKDTVAIEQTDDTATGEDATTGDEVSDDSVSIDIDGGEEVSIDIDVEDNKPETKADGAEDKPADGLEIEGGEVKKEAKAEDKPEEGLAIDSDKAPKLPGDDKAKKNDTVLITIGEVGRKDPFVPLGQVGTMDPSKIDKKEQSVGFEVIEPPQLGVQSDELTRLLNTKVAGILYDQVRPSAIINIDGIDQLVRAGDSLSGFDIIAITKNKVVIQSDNNVYRASVGQPLNAEKIENSVEIANLKTKFWGSENHTRK